MEVMINVNKVVMMIEPKTIHFNSSEKVDNSLKHKIHFVIQHNKFLAEHTIQSEIS